MNSVFKKLTIRTFFSNFKQFLSVILIVFMASMLLSGFITNYYMFDNAITTYFDKTNLADLWFYVEGVDENDEQFFSNLGVEYEKRLYIETKAGISSGLASNNAKIYIYDEGKISNPYIETGQWWGCVIDKNVYSNNNLQLGIDEIQFTVSYEYLGQNFEFDLSFVITGTMSLDECADSFSSWPILISKEAFLAKVNTAICEMLGIDYQEFIQELPYNQILVKTEDLEATVSTVQEYYQTSSQNELYYSFDRTSIESVVLLNSEIDQSRKMIYVFPIIFLFVSILIILTTINQLVLQERQRIGTLKSIGIPDKKIMRHYSKFGALLCAIGSVLGVIFGIAIIPSIMFIKYNLVYSIPDDYVVLTIPYLYILLVIFGITLLGYLVSVCACHSILHKKPVDLLRFNVSSSRIKGTGRLKKLPFTLKMAIRNIRIKPIRTIMATIGIAGCMALLLCGFGIGDTLDYSISYDFGRNFHYDITTTYTDDMFEYNLYQLPGMTYYEKYEKMYVSVSANNSVKNTNLFKIEEQSLMTDIYVLLGETVISKSIADEMEISRGDKITITLGSKMIELEVTKIVTTSVMNGIFICDDYGFDESYKTLGMWIECSDVTDEKIDFINSINGTNTGYSMSQYIDNINTKISSINIMTTTLKIFAIALAIVVLLNLILLILKERVREIATLKVLGRNQKSIMLTLLFEILIMSICGSIIGMILGYPLLVLVLSINKVEVLNYLYKINFISYILSILIVGLTILVVTLLGYNKVKKINMIESLKSVE